MPVSKSQQVTVRIDSIRSYLLDIGRIPLLSCEQENTYGRQVQQMMSLITAKDTLAEELCREPTLQEWAKYTQLSEAQLNEVLSQGQRSKQKMIEANLRLVVAIAKTYQNRGLELLDLIQEGTIGLKRGVEKFDPTRGYKFSTYASWWIKQALTRGIGEKSRAIRLPVHIIEKLNQIKKVTRQLSQELGRTPTVSDLAVKLQLEPEQLRQFLKLSQKPISLNLRVGDEHDTELGELLPEATTQPEDYAVNLALALDLSQLISKLNLQQREVITFRFGLNSGQALTLVETGNRLNLCRERVRQIECAALEKLRQHEEMLEDYLI